VVRDRDWLALRWAILSGFPTVTTPHVSLSPISGPIQFVRPHDWRSKQMPLAREDIPTFLTL